MTDYGGNCAVGDVVIIAIYMRLQAAAVISASIDGNFAAPNGNCIRQHGSPLFVARLVWRWSISGELWRPAVGARTNDGQCMSVHALHKQE